MLGPWASSPGYWKGGLVSVPTSLTWPAGPGRGWQARGRGLQAARRESCVCLCVSLWACMCLCVSVCVSHQRLFCFLSSLSPPPLAVSLSSSAISSLCVFFFLMRLNYGVKSLLQLLSAAPAPCPPPSSPFFPRYRPNDLTNALENKAPG